MDASIAQNITSVAGSLITSNLTAVLYTLLCSFSFYFLFEESGEEGWKRFIPFYGDYVAFKLFYKKGLFWLNTIAIIIGILSLLILAGIGAYANMQNGIMGSDLTAIMLISFLLLIISIIIVVFIAIGFDISISHKFGKKGLFTLGMIFLTPLFLFALAFENRKKLK